MLLAAVGERDGIGAVDRFSVRFLVPAVVGALVVVVHVVVEVIRQRFLVELEAIRVELFIPDGCLFCRRYQTIS